MITMNPFIFEPMMKSYTVKGHKIELQLEPGVFCPSEHGSKIGDYIDVRPGEYVFDMGTGILGIVAAKEGGIVDVGDPLEKAVNLAIKNGKLNNVKLNGYIGEYFCTQKEKYDYLTANLPHEIIPETYATEIGDSIKSIDGGLNGNEYILKMLDQAHVHMHTGSRALVCAYSMSDCITTIDKMNSLYYPKLLDVFTNPAKDFVQENISYYMPLIKSGKVALFKKDGLWQSTIFIYELRKR